jgi:hypothetical protein
MTSNRSKKTSIAAKNAEIEWVVAHERETSAERSVEAERIDEHELDVHQPSPDEVVWTPTEPQDVSDTAGGPRVAKKAPRAADAKPARSAGKPQRKATDDDATDAVSANDEPATSASQRKPKRASKRSATQPEAAEGASTQDDAAERKETLGEQHAPEVATAVTEPNAAGPLAKKRSLQKFVAERAEQRAREHADERALKRAGGAPSDAPVPVAKRERGKQAVQEQPTTLPVAQPETPNPSDVAAVAPADAPAEPDSTLPSMETYIAELATMSVAQLSKRHVEVLGKKPRIKNRTWLQRKLAWFEQTRRFGGLSGAAKKRLDELMGEIQLPTPTSRAPKSDAPTQRSADELPLGTRLERKWRDRVIVATRIEGGWDCEGTIYRTLSAAAKAVTQSHVSGPAFFGIWKPKSGGTR